MILWWLYGGWITIYDGKTTIYDGKNHCQWPFVGIASHFWVVNVGLAQNYGTNEPQKWSCLVGKASILEVDHFEPQPCGYNNAINHPVGHGWNPNYGDDWGMVYSIVIPTSHRSLPGNAELWTQWIDITRIIGIKFRLMGDLHLPLYPLTCNLNCTPKWRGTFLGMLFQIGFRRWGAAEPSETIFSKKTPRIKKNLLSCRPSYLIHVYWYMLLCKHT